MINYSLEYCMLSGRDRKWPKGEFISKRYFFWIGVAQFSCWIH